MDQSTEISEINRTSKKLVSKVGCVWITGECQIYENMEKFHNAEYFYSQVHNQVAGANCRS